MARSLPPVLSQQQGFLQPTLRQFALASPKPSSKALTASRTFSQTRSDKPVSSDHVVVTDEAGIRIIRMNRPDKKNALTQSMYNAMSAALNDANGNDAVRVVMFAGVPGAFSAGNDLQDFLALAQSGKADARPSVDFLVALATSAKPMVAA